MQKLAASLQTGNKQLELQIKIYIYTIYNSTKNEIHSHKSNKRCTESVCGKLQNW